MRVGIPAERAPGERRVAAVPATVRNYVEGGLEVVVESGAGSSSGHSDAEYAAAGATVVEGGVAAHDADIVLRVGPPTVSETDMLGPGTVLLSFLDPYVDTALVDALRQRSVTALALEAIPRTTLAQSLDALSSQATVAGYAAVVLAASESPRFLPMLITAAGTIPPAKTLVLGVGVAGLQAIATARRLGAVVYAYDIRVETKEQVESLGARFVEAPTQEGDEGGYATEVGADVQRRQFEILAPYVADADLVVSTAQIPGRPAPRLVNVDMVEAMRDGSVIIDMAAATGGNVEGSVPDERVVVQGTTILGPTDLPSRVPADASRMYSRNLEELLKRVVADGELRIDLEDEIIGGAAITHAGEIVSQRARAVLESAGG